MGRYAEMYARLICVHRPYTPPVPHRACGHFTPARSLPVTGDIGTCHLPTLGDTAMSAATFNALAAARDLETAGIDAEHAFEFGRLRRGCGRGKFAGNLGLTPDRRLLDAAAAVRHPLPANEGHDFPKRRNQWKPRVKCG